MRGRSTRWMIGALSGLALLAPATASAEKVVEAQTMWRYDALSYTMDRGESLVFRNADLLSPGPHDVTATSAGPDGSPLFASATIPNGQQAPVVGAERLPAGSYEFVCSVHSFMQATLEVREAPGGPPPPPPQPPPAPPPSSPPENGPPDVSVAIRSKSLREVLRTRRLGVQIRTDETVELRMRATASLRGRARTIGRARVQSDPGTWNFTVRLTSAARERLRRLRRARVTVAVEARDSAGNVSKATARTTLRG